MKKRCPECQQLLDASSFNANVRQPDGLAKKCSACVNRRRRELHADKNRTIETKPVHLATLVKRGDFAAFQRNPSLINVRNRDRLLALAVTDFKSAPKKPGHVELVRYLIQKGARPNFQLVCAATIGPHLDILNALIEAGAEQNIYTAAAIGDVKRLCKFLADISKSTQQISDEVEFSHQCLHALNYACASELGKVDEVHAQNLIDCAKLLLDQCSTRIGNRDPAINPLDSCASRGGNQKIAELLIARGWSPSITTLMSALGHGQRHGHGNYGIAELCLLSGVDINQTLGGRTLLHAFAHQGDLVGTTWLLERGAKINTRDQGNNTPLHKACERNSTLKVVELLVNRGARLNLTNHNGETPLDVAIKNDKKMLADYLRRIRTTRSKR